MCCMWLWQNYVWNWSRKEEKGTWRNSQAFCWLSQFHCRQSLQDFTHIILQHRNTFVLKKSPEKDRVTRCYRAPRNQEWAAPWLKLPHCAGGLLHRMPPDTNAGSSQIVYHQHLSGVTLREQVRGMRIAREVGPRGEQRENRSMAFAQSFDLSVAFPQGTGCWLSMKPQWVSTQQNGNMQPSNCYPIICSIIYLVVSHINTLYANIFHQLDDPFMIFWVDAGS